MIIGVNGQMSFKKKMAATTLAGMIATTAFAGIPLSTKGLAEALGFGSTAYAADAFADNAFLTRMTKLHAALNAGDPADVQDVRDLRDAIAALNYADDSALIDPIWNKLAEHVEPGDEAQVKETLFGIFTAVFGAPYDPNASGLEDIRANPDNQAALQLLASAGGVDDLEVADITAFIADIESTVKSQLTGKTVGDLGVLLASEGERSKLVKTVVAAVLSHDSVVVSKMLGELDVTTDDIVATIDLFQAEPGIADKIGPAQNAMAVAYLRSETTGSISTSTDGRTKTVALSALGISIPAALLNWSVSGAAAVTAGSTPGTFTLGSSASSGTAVIKASLPGVNKVIYQQEVPFSATGSNNGGGGGGVVIVTPPPATQPKGDQAVADIGKLADQIKNATGAEKQQLVQQAVANAASAIQTLSRVDLSSKVSTVNGKTTVTVEAADLSGALDEIKKVVDALKAAAPGSEADLPQLVLTIDAGTSVTGSADVSLKADTLAQAEAAGAAGVELKLGTVSATLPLGGEFKGDVNFTVGTTPSSEATVGWTAASDVYDFGVTVGGRIIDSFQKPIAIDIELKNLGDVDKDLLTLAKIIEGKLQIVGGLISGNVIREMRSSFSQYVVVENKVSFKDTAAVASWAGRQIEVVAAKGAIEGRAAGVFAPQGEVTRAEFAKMLILALNLDSNAAASGFSDVQADDWFAPYVASAAQAGIINGRTATSFAPKATITRAEMATMVTRALKAAKGLKDVADVDAALAGFADAASINDTLKAGVALASSEGIVIGSNGKFNPNATATRAEAAVMIYRAINK